MNQVESAESPWPMDLADLDVSRPSLYLKDQWRPFFERLRNEDPVHFHEDSRFGPYWSITKFDDIVAVDTNHKQFSSAKGITIADAAASLPISSFITSDPPTHGPKRRAVQPVVVPQNLKHLESLIRSRSIEILESLPVGEEFNWVELVSINLTTQMLATLFGFPFEDRHKLTLWSDNLTTGVSPKDVEGTARNRAVMLECLQYFQALWHERKQTEGGFDLLSLMQRDPATASMVDDPMHFLGNIALLIVGGNDTTRNSISGGVLALNQNPAQYDKLRADHSLIDSMVPEIIRWQTPLIHMRRTAIEDVELKGRTIRKGDKVVMWYISGNRDDTVIENADDFIIDRPNSRHHLAFGFGIHRCMGNRLAEMQLRVLWEEIMQRFEMIEVVGPEQRVRSNFIRGYTELPVVAHPL